MIERDQQGQFVRIRCDTCDAPSPPTSDIFINRGLNNMDWHCLGGSHLCPDCVEPIAEAAE